MASSSRTAWVRMLLPFAALALGSCQYLGARALDFVDQYRLVVGAGSVIGVRAKAVGVWDTGLMIGVKPKAAALGVRYGGFLYFDSRDGRMDADQAEIIKTTSLVDFDYGKGSYLMGRNSAAILPGLFSWVDSTPTDYDEWRVPEEGNTFDDRYWIWSSEGFGQARWAQIHAFDIEGEIGLFVYIDAGYSIGEFVDFLLGLFTIDIAKDDVRIYGDG